VEDSLRRLGVDVIDLYQIHWPRPEEDIEEAWEEMAKLREEGKIRHAGVCNFSIEQLDRIRSIAPVASLQPPYSMFTRRIEGGLLEYCARHEIGLVVYGTLQFGLLTGKFSPSLLASLPEDDWRHGNRHFQGELFLQHLSTIERLRAVAEEEAISLAELAISWTLRRGEVTSSIVGARRPDQIDETASAGAHRLSPRTVDRIEAILVG
jgi:aryl-alcohol dehydrogenase-like predicted oxidoreductase